MNRPRHKHYFTGEALLATHCTHQAGPCFLLHSTSPKDKYLLPATSPACHQSLGLVYNSYKLVRVKWHLSRLSHCL